MHQHECGTRQLRQHRMQIEGVEEVCERISRQDPDDEDRDI